MKNIYLTIENIFYLSEISDLERRMGRRGIGLCLKRKQRWRLKFPKPDKPGGLFSGLCGKLRAPSCSSSYDALA